MPPMVDPPSKALSSAEIKQRKQHIGLVLTDCDGVLTDAGVYYSEHGEAMKRFSIRDGMGVERLRQRGIETGIMTGEQSAIVARRAEKLQMPHVFLGVKDKRRKLEDLLRGTELSPRALAYIGDDVNDLEAMEFIAAYGLTAAPEDAMPEVIRASHYHCSTRGGYGAFREFAEWLLAQGGSK